MVKYALGNVKCFALTHSLSLFREKCSSLYIYQKNIMISSEQNDYMNNKNNAEAKCFLLP